VQAAQSGIAVTGEIAFSAKGQQHRAVRPTRLSEESSHFALDFRRKRSMNGHGRRALTGSLLSPRQRR
jgi:hypothetical protein